MIYNKRKFGAKTLSPNYAILEFFVESDRGLKNKFPEHKNLPN